MLVVTRFFELSIILGAPKGSPLMELYKHEAGGGVGMILGPIQFDVSRPWRTPNYETNNPPSVALSVGSSPAP